MGKRFWVCPEVEVVVVDELVDRGTYFIGSKVGGLVDIQVSIFWERCWRRVSFWVEGVRKAMLRTWARRRTMRFDQEWSVFWVREVELLKFVSWVRRGCWETRETYYVGGELVGGMYR